MKQITNEELTAFLAAFKDDQPIWEDDQPIWIDHPSFKHPQPLYEIKFTQGHIVLKCEPEMPEMIENPCKEVKTPEVVVFADGACSGNPGPGGWAYLIEAFGKVYQDQGQIREKTTNQQMELCAVIAALTKLKAMGVQNAVVHTDSEYVVKTMKGQYKKKANIYHWNTIDNIICGGKLDITWEHVKAGSHHYQINCDVRAKNAVERAKLLYKG